MYGYKLYVKQKKKERREKENNMFSRNGMIIKCNGNEKNMEEFNQYVYHQVKFGHRMLVI